MALCFSFCYSNLISCWILISCFIRSVCVCVCVGAIFYIHILQRFSKQRYFSFIANFFFCELSPLCFMLYVFCLFYVTFVFHSLTFNKNTHSHTYTRHRRHFNRFVDIMYCIYVLCVFLCSPKHKKKTLILLQTVLLAQSE